MRLPDEEKAKAREEFCKELRNRWWPYFEKMLTENKTNFPSSSFLYGTSLTIADLSLLQIVRWFSSGVLDGVPKDACLKDFPSIRANVDAVMANPMIHEWYQNKKKE